MPAPAKPYSLAPVFAFLLLVLVARPALALLEWEEVPMPAIGDCCFVEGKAYKGHLYYFVNPSRELWRMDSNDNWQQIVTPLTGPDYVFIRGTFFFKGLFYVAVDNNTTHEAELWRTDNGVDWEFAASIEGSAIGAHWPAFVGDYVYIMFGTIDTLYRSSDGVNWERRGRVPYNSFGLQPMQGYIYSLIRTNGHDVGMYRTADGGETWELVTDDSFGTHEDWSAMEMIPFQGALYAGLCNYFWSLDVFRVNQDLTFDRVVHQGLDDTALSFIQDLYIFGSQLYAASRSGTATDPHGAQLWRTSNGDDWEHTMENGFGNPELYSISHNGLAGFNDQLYAPTGNYGSCPNTYVAGPKLFRTVNRLPHPTCDNTPLSTEYMTPVTLTMSGTDADNDSLDFETYDLDSDNGTLGVERSRKRADRATLTYTPPENYNGTTTIAWAVDDGNMRSEWCEVEVTVAGPEDESSGGGGGCSLNLTEFMYAWPLLALLGLAGVYIFSRRGKRS